MGPEKQEEDESEDDESEEDEEEDEGEEVKMKKPKKSKAEAFLEKTKTKKPEEKKIEIKPADLKKKSKFEEMKNKANIKVDIPTEQPIRRKKKTPVVEEAVPFLKEEEVESTPPAPKDKVSDEFSEKEAKPKEDEKVVIEPKELPTKEKEDEEDSEEESSSDEDNEWSKKPKKSKAEAFLEKTKKKKPEEKKIEIKPADLSKKKNKFEEMKNKANLKVELPTEQPIRRKKKAPVVEEEVPFLKEEEVESAPPLPTPAPEEGEPQGPPPKEKVSDEFAEKDVKPKEDEKIVIEPKELPTEEKGDEEESEEESSSDEDGEWSKKPKKSKAEAFLA